MKHFACILSVLLSVSHANAQVAQWLVPPEYDAIEVSPENNVILAQQGFNHHIWNMNGKCLAKVSDDIFPFSDGYAVSTTPETADITAIYNIEGQKTAIEDHVQLGWGYPYFHDGFLLVHDGRYFYYMDYEGGIDPKPYYRAYPFSHGYASCFTYANMRKMKDPMHMIIDTNLEAVPLKWANKPMALNDIEFISTVSDDGVSIIIYKAKLYFFDAATAELSPVLPSSDTNIKNQAHIDSDIDEALKQVDDNTKMLTGKCGKARFSINFDALTLKPINMKIGNEERSFQKSNPTHSDGPTVLKEVKDLTTGKFGLHMGNTEILPPQLDAVEKLKGNTALVTMNDKLGLLRVNADDHFTFRINDNEDIGFRHKHFNTTIRLNMPAYINAEETSIEIDPQSGCNIDKRTKVAKNNSDGSYVQYDCKLVCPQNVGDEAMVVSYPAYIVYQGLRTPMTAASGKAWHSKYFAVDVNEQEVSLSGSTLSFVVNVVAERLPGEEVYPFIPSLATDNLTFEMEKITDTRYKCKVFNLKRGRNNIIVRVTEEGCPPADYTFEVDYSPQVEQGKKNVTMTKKKVTTPTPATPTKPVLRI